MNYILLMPNIEVSPEVSVFLGFSFLAIGIAIYGYYFIRCVIPDIFRKIKKDYESKDWL